MPKEKQNKIDDSFELEGKKYPLPTHNEDGTFQIQDVQCGLDGKKTFY